MGYMGGELSARNPTQYIPNGAVGLIDTEKYIKSRGTRSS